MGEDVEARLKQLEESERRAWNAINALSEKTAQLDGVVDALAEAYLKTQMRFQEVAERFRETDERFARTDERFAKTDERIAEVWVAMRQTDSRIEKLVSAMGEFISKGNPER